MQTGVITRCNTLCGNHRCNGLRAKYASPNVTSERAFLAGFVQHVYLVGDQVGETGSTAIARFTFLCFCVLFHESFPIFIYGMLNVRLSGDGVENSLEDRNLLLKAVGTRIRKKASKKETKKKKQPDVSLTVMF